MKNKKILFFDFNIPDIVNNSQSRLSGGASVQAYNWMLGLNNNGVDVGVVVEDREYPKKDDDIAYVKSYKNNRGIPFFNWIYYRYPKLKNVIINYKPDFIYQAGAGFITYVLSVVAKKTGVTFIHRIANDVDTDSRLKKKLGFFNRFFYKKGVKNASIILCQNLFQYNNIKNKYPQKKVAVFHNPFDVSLAVKKPKSFGERKYVAWVGIFQYQKNMMLLVEIAEQLPNIRFCIAGKPKLNLDKKTIEAVERLQNLNNVEFVGVIKRSEIIDFLSNASFLLNTSFYEGFSNTFLEAFAAGTPVITTKNVDPDNIIYENKLGIAVSDKTILKDKIKEFYNNPLGYDKYVTMCLEYLKTKHDINFLAQKLISYLNNKNDI